MRPIELLSVEEARRIEVFLFDLDDTLLDHGHLTLPAYQALFALRDAGLRLVAVTGRPRGWGDVVVRQWPIDGAVTENGAIACELDGRRLVTLDWAGPDRVRRQALVEETARAVAARFPALRRTDDTYARLSDIAFDIGENVTLGKDTVHAACELARSLGARTVVSSVHLHVTFDAADKASGAVRFLSRKLGMDPTLARSRAAFIGDSENDEACFGAFMTTLTVKNFRGRPTVAPRFVTRGERGAGFAEAVEVLLARRRGSSS